MTCIQCLGDLSKHGPFHDNGKPVLLGRTALRYEEAGLEPVFEKIRWNRQNDDRTPRPND